MADRIGTLLNRSGDGGEEVLIVSRGKERTRFRRRDELDWNFRVESTDSENVVEVAPKPKPTRTPKAKSEPKPARRASRPRGQRVAYVRVSAADQNEARQLEAVGECDRVYVEKQSARSRADRVELEECIRYLRDGDELVVASMDRLARSLVDLKQIVGEITAKGASVEFVHERATYAAGAQDPRADLMLSLLGAFAEFERAIIREGHWGVWQLPHVTMGRQPGVAFDDPLPLLPGGQVFHYVGPGRVDAYTRRAAESHRTWLCTTAPFG